MANKKLLQIVIDAKNNTAKSFDKVNKDTTGLNKGFAKMGFALVGIAGSFGYLGKKMIEAAADFEQTTIAFTTMLGSAEKANTLLRDLAEFAARTPFELKDVEKGAKALLAFGIEETKILPTLKSLGDVSAGLSVPMERLILNFGQVKAQTKLTGRELRDFAIAGVPILDELAKNLNKSKAEILDLVSAGKIGFPEVEAAFKSMSSEGGKFYDLMDKQSKTFLGRISNIKDSWDLFLREQGAALLVFAGIAVEKLALILDWLRADAEGFNFVSKTILTLGKFFKALGKTFWNVAKIISEFIALSIEGFINIGKSVVAFAKDFIKVFKNIKKIGLSVFSAFNKAMKGDFSGAAEEIKKTFQDTFSNSINNARDFQTRASYHLDQIKNDFFEIGTSWSNFASLRGMNKVIGEFGVLGTAIKEKIVNNIDGAADAFSKYQEKIKDFADNSKDALNDLGIKISEINKKMEELMLGKQADQQSLGEEWAQAYVDQENKVADLQAQWQNETDQNKKDLLFAELEREKQVLADKKTIELAYQEEVNEIRRRASITEFERVQEDLIHKQNAISREFEMKKNQLQKELNLEMNKFAKILEINAIALKEQEKFLALGEKQSAESINREIEKYNELAKAITRAKAGQTSGFVNVGAGVEARASQQIAPVNIVINGDVSGEDLIDKVKNSLWSSLQMNGQVAT